MIFGTVIIVVIALPHSGQYLKASFSNVTLQLSHLNRNYPRPEHSRE